MFPSPSHPPESSILVPCPEHRVLTDPYDPCLVTVITTWENVLEKQSGARPHWTEAEVIETGRKRNTEKIFFIHFPLFYMHSMSLSSKRPLPHFPLSLPLITVSPLPEMPSHLHQLLSVQILHPFHAATWAMHSAHPSFPSRQLPSAPLT